MYISLKLKANFLPMMFEIRFTAAEFTFVTSQRFDGGPGEVI